MAAAKFKQRVLGTGGGRFGSGSNYTDFNTAGYMTASGTGRVTKEIWLGAADFKLASAASAHATTGSLYMAVGGQDTNIGTISASSTTCDMLFNAAFSVPLDAANSGSVVLFMELLVNTSLGTASSGLGFKVIYNYINNGASLTTTGSVQGTVTGGSLVGTRISGSLPALASFGAGGQLIALNFRGLTGACSAGSLFDVAGVRARYYSDKLGLQST